MEVAAACLGLPKGQLVGYAVTDLGSAGYKCTNSCFNILRLQLQALASIDLTGSHIEFKSFLQSTSFNILQHAMIFTGLVVSSLAIVAVSAAPASLKVRQATRGPACTGLGAGVFDVAPSFTLAAYYKTQPNANSTGVPLVLGSDGATTGGEFYVLSVRATL
jgi:hypothetical protein